MDITISVLDWLSQPVSHLSSIEQISATDAYIIERKHGSGSSLEHFNKKLTYNNLSARVLNDISARLNFNTMAYKEVWQYDLKSHEHDYSLVDIFPNYTSSEIIEQYSRDWRYTASQVQTFAANPHLLSEWIGTMAIWQTSSICIGNDSRGRAVWQDRYVEISTDIYMPHIIIPKYAQPDIGEVRFLARNSCPAVDSSIGAAKYLVKDNEHDGYWAYPRGQRIVCAANEFKNACKMYGDGGKTGLETSFTVPSLTNFLKLNPGIQGSNAMQFTQHQTNLPQHKHLFAIDSSQTTFITAKMTIAAKKDYDNNNITNISHVNEDATKVDGYCTKDALDMTGVTVTPNISIAGAQTAAAGTNDEAYPAYNDLPILIYIGRRYGD